LRWSHEESLRNSEDYQRRIRTYENTLNAYQRRITELTQGSSPAGADELPSSAVNAPETPGLEDDDSLKKRAIQLEDEVRQILEKYGPGAGGTN